MNIKNRTLRKDAQISMGQQFSKFTISNILSNNTDMEGQYIKETSAIKK